jgi:hypothetical protein
MDGVSISLGGRPIGFHLHTFLYIQGGQIKHSLLEPSITVINNTWRSMEGENKNTWRSKEGDNKKSEEPYPNKPNIANPIPVR